MDRDLGTPKDRVKEAHRHVPLWHMAQPVLPLKQTRRGLRGDDSKYGLVQSAHYKDATSTRSFTGEH